MILWLPFSLGLYAFVRPQVAFLVSLIGGNMLLPEILVLFKVPGFMEFTKTPYLSLITVLGLLIFHRRVFSRFKFGALDVLFILLCIFGALTAWTNLDPVSDGIIRYPGHTIMDGVKFTYGTVFTYVIPMLAARLLFQTERDLKVLMVGYALLATVHMLPFLFEVRMSPTLHRYWYGFYQHDFRQTRRGDGYRPMLFMAHGLAVALVNSNSFIAATALRAAKVRVGRFTSTWLVLIAGGLLAIGRSLGALVFGVAGGLLVTFTRPKTQALVAAIIGSIVLTYPVLRAADFFDPMGIADFIAENVSEERAGSLRFRFIMEADIAERAAERPFFGWGGYCRSCVRDPETGDKASVADGEWVIVYGAQGMLGFLAFFGVMLVPILVSYSKIRTVPERVARQLLGGLSVICALNMADLVPNSLFAPTQTMVLYGALYSLSIALADPSTIVEDQPFARFAEILGRLRAGVDPR